MFAWNEKLHFGSVRTGPERLGQEDQCEGWGVGRKGWGKERSREVEEERGRGGGWGEEREVLQKQFRTTGFWVIGTEPSILGLVNSCTSALLFQETTFPGHCCYSNSVLPSSTFGLVLRWYSHKLLSEYLEVHKLQQLLFSYLNLGIQIL